MKYLSVLFHFLGVSLACSFSIKNVIHCSDNASRLNMVKTKGSAAKPFEKKRVAVFGAGGYLGATLFGFLQRASSIYGTGLGGSASPRAICATAVGSISLNKIINQTFKLAFAGEDLVRLTNMQDVDHIEERLKGFDAAILGTIYTCETRPITLNTYNLTPNQKTMEFYLDDRYGVDDEMKGKMEFHLNLFNNSVKACKAAGLQHIVVIESPNTPSAKPFAEILDKNDIAFTYIRASGTLENTKYFTFEEGIQGNIRIDGFTFADDYSKKIGYKYGDWSDNFEIETIDTEKGNIAREDLAAVAVQGIMSLDWSKSRFLDVWCDGKLNPVDEKDDTNAVYVPKKILKSDRDWCVNSSSIQNIMINID